MASSKLLKSLQLFTVYSSPPPEAGSLSGSTISPRQTFFAWIRRFQPDKNNLVFQVARLPRQIIWPGELSELSEQYLGIISPKQLVIHNFVIENRQTFLIILRSRSCFLFFSWSKARVFFFFLKSFYFKLHLCSSAICLSQMNSWRTCL